MNNKMLLACVGAASFIAGVAFGYFVSKKNFDKRVKSIRDTYECFKNKKEAEAEVKEEPKKEETEKPEEEEKEEEEEEEEVDTEALVYELAEEEEKQLDRIMQFYDEDAYVNNISEEEFATNMRYDKVEMVICLSDDRAYNADTGEEIEDYHVCIGDKDYDTLNPEREDDFGDIYIRNEHLGVDYKITYSNAEWR